MLCEVKRAERTRSTLRLQDHLELFGFFSTTSLDPAAHVPTCTFPSPRGPLIIPPTQDFVSRRFEVIVGHKLLATVIVLSLFAVGLPSLPAQNPTLPPLPQVPSPSDRTTPAEDEARSKLERDMAKKANQERQLALKRDTEKLLKLSTELKDYVDKTNENMLSLEVVKKAEEIEKLAHSVKNKMKGN
jgi:hypothetical protein